MKKFIHTFLIFYCFINAQTCYSQSSKIIALIEVQRNNWLYVNEEGALVLKAQTEDYQFSEGLLIRFEKNKVGFVDCSGNWVIEPTFDKVQDFHNGIAWVKKGLEWMPINTDGVVITEERFESFHPFSDGMASVKLIDTWGYIDTTGRLAVFPQYNSVEDFKNGLASVAIDKKWFVINKKGEIVIEPEESNYTFLGGYSNGRIRARTGSYGGKPISWGFIDSLGNKVISSMYKNAEDFSDGLARVREEDKWGYINAEGAYVILPLFKHAEDFQGGYASVEMDGKWGIIDTKGRWVWKPQFDILWKVVNGYAAVRTKGDWGIINVNGKWTFQPQFKYVKSIVPFNCPN